MEEIEQVEAANQTYDSLGMEIEMAIDERAQGDPALSRMLWDDARRMLARQVEPADVAQRILQGAVNDD
jgi:hypothetical protein